MYREALVLSDSAGRTVFRIANYKADVEFVQNLTGDKTPDLVLYTWDGNGHGEIVYYVYSLGKRPRCLIAYQTVSMGEKNFDLKDLNGDGRKEILGWYGGFFYRYGDHGDEDMIPVILGYRNGRYVEVTQRYRPRLRARLTEAEQKLKATVERQGDGVITADRGDFYDVVRCYTAALLLEPPAAARHRLLRILPKRDHAEFLRHHREIERILRDRSRCYTYPRAYHQ